MSYNLNHYPIFNSSTMVMNIVSFLFKGSNRLSIFILGLSEFSDIIFVYTSFFRHCGNIISILLLGSCQSLDVSNIFGVSFESSDVCSVRLLNFTYGITWCLNSSGWISDSSNVLSIFSLIFCKCQDIIVILAVSRFKIINFNEILLLVCRQRLNIINVLGNFRIGSFNSMCIINLLFVLIRHFAIKCFYSSRILVKSGDISTLLFVHILHRCVSTHLFGVFSL